MTSTIQLLEKALQSKRAADWCRDLNISTAAFAQAKKRGRLSPLLAGNIAIDLGENPDHWMAVAAIRPIQWPPMEDSDLQALMARLELLIKRVEQLKSQNGLLLAQEKTWREERAHLIEKNEIARQKVESMISRLKALEQDS